jgi:hypothetical protein
MSTISYEQRLVDELRAHLNIKRIEVSIACGDLIKYCQMHEADDKLLRPMKYQNPSFKDKRSKCFPVRR